LAQITNKYPEDKEWIVPIIGPYAPILIQEVVNAMTSGGHIDEINEGIHIHPALSELIQTTVNSLDQS